MLRVMIAKELREAAGIVAIAAAFYVHYLSRAMRHDILPWHYGYVDYNAIPFINLNSLGSLAWVSAALALALGFRQTVGESIYGTWLFLRHRPVGWRWLLGVKLLVGLAVYLVCAAAAVLAYAWWAATPGTHASPFEWSMTAPAWKDWITMPACVFRRVSQRPSAGAVVRHAPAAAGDRRGAGVLVAQSALVARWRIVHDRDPFRGFCRRDLLRCADA